MANGVSTYLETAVLNWMFKKTAMPTVPATLYYALHSADPGDTGASELTSTGSYARAALATDTNASTHVNYNAQVVSGTAQMVSNLLNIAFPPATAAWNGGSAILWFSIWDASTAGNCLYSGPIAGGSGVTVNNGTTLTFTGGATGQMTVSLD